MDRTASAAHASHDESLIARFYGGDVSEDERVGVIELMAACPDCAALFADLAAIADAVEAMPVPPRPRDFTLTEEDAARLRPRRLGLSAVFGVGLRRSLGSSLAALGLVGMVLTGAASLLGGTPTADMLTTQGERAAVVTTAGTQDTAIGAGAVAMPTAGPVSTAALAPVAGGTPGPAQVAAATPAAPELAAASPAGMDQTGSLNGGTSAGQPAASPAGATVQPLPPSQNTGVAFGGIGAIGTTEPQFLPAPSTTGSGMDARLVWIVGFGVLFAIGLVIAILPRRPRNRGRGARG